MKRLLYVLIFLVFIPEIYAQENLPQHFTIRGTVKNSGNGRPVAFASVSVTGSNIGTVTNPDGEFTLKIPVNGNFSKISISHIGYMVAGYKINDIIDMTGEFLLTPHNVAIQEVVIRPADARSIVAEAVNSVAANYPDFSNRLTGFYRETIKQRKDYVSISEAIVEIYQAPYNVNEKDMFRIVQGRKSGDVKKADTLLVKLRGGPHVSMLLDIVKNPDLLISDESLNYYHFEMVDMVKIDGESNYVISFTPRVSLSYPLYQGNFYISTESHAFTMADFSIDLSDREKAARGFILKKPARLRFNPTGSRYLVTYKEVEGKYHINYMRYELEFFADWRRRLFRTGYTIMSEMAITSRSTENVSRYANRDAFRSTYILADQVPVYFEDEFWGEYNYIEPDQSIEAAIRKLNRQMDR